MRLEVELYRAVEDAVERMNAQAKAAGGDGRGLLEFKIDKIGDRPAAQLPEDSPLMEALQRRGPPSVVKYGVAAGLD